MSARRIVRGFAQYQVSDGDEATALDLSWDTRLYPPQSTDVGPALATDELAADKMLALFGRAEARDFVDVYRFRAAGYSRDDLMRLAAGKDQGFSAHRFAEAVGGIERYRRDDFPIADTMYSELRDEFARWWESSPSSSRRSNRRGRGDRIGSRPASACSPDVSDSRARVLSTTGLPGPRQPEWDTAREAGSTPT